MRTKRDVTKIAQFEHDEATDSKRVSIVDTEMAIELNHADGDSVTSHPAKLSASALGVSAEDNGTVIIPPLDCSSLRLLQLYVDGSGVAVIECSPSDTEDFWVELINSSLGQKEVVARRVRVKSTNAVGNVHLVGRS